MKIGILTFHEAINPGAFLQALATQQLLQRLGYKPQVINYTSPKHRFHPWRQLLLHPKIIMQRQSWDDTYQRNKAYSQCQQHLNLTRRFTSSTQLKKEHFDAVIIGSDIVWNYQNIRLGKDPVYFGKNLTADRLIAFAPSCGNIDSSLDIPPYIYEGLPKFYRLSVRDDKTANFVQRITGKRPVILGDPTLTLNMLKMPVVCDNKSDYILIYAIHNTIADPLRLKIINFAKKSNLKIEGIFYRTPWADKNFITANPFEWLGKIQQARYIVTTTFHGTVFSIICGKQFITNYNVHIESKTKPFLKALDLEERAISPNDDIATVLNKPYDTSVIRSHLEFNAQESLAFLKDALK